MANEEYFDDTTLGILVLDWIKPRSVMFICSLISPVHFIHASIIHSSNGCSSLETS